MTRTSAVRVPQIVNASVCVFALDQRPRASSVLPSSARTTIRKGDPAGSVALSWKTPSSGVARRHVLVFGRLGGEPCPDRGWGLARPRVEDVLLEGCERRRIRGEAPVDQRPAEGGRSLPELVQHPVRLCEPFTRVEGVPPVLVAGVDRVLLGPPADAELTRPALRPPVDRAPRRVRAVEADVMPVLVAGDLLRGHAGRARDLAGEVELPAAEAPDRLISADGLQLRERRDVDADELELRAVEESSEEVRPAERRVRLGLVGIGDVHLHDLAVRRGRRAPVPADGRPAPRRLLARRQLGHERELRDSSVDRRLSR